MIATGPATPIPLPNARPRDIPIRRKPRAFATDLVDALAGAPAGDRATASRRLQRLGGLTLIYATDLDLEEATQLADAASLPDPDIYIASGGSVLWSDELGYLLGALAVDLTAHWPGHTPVARAVADLGQPVTKVKEWTAGVRYRVTDPSRVVESLERFRIALKGLPVDVRIRDHRFLDVAPAGTTLGHTLLKVLDVLGVPRAKTIVGGHLLEEWALLSSRVGGFALPDVGPVAQAVVRQTSRRFLTQRAGATGMVEGIERFV